MEGEISVVRNFRTTTKIDSIVDKIEKREVGNYYLDDISFDSSYRTMRMESSMLI